MFSINTARMVSSNSKLSSKTYTRVKTINNSKNWNRSSTMLEIFTTPLLVKISPLFPTISTLLSLKRLVSVSGMISSPMNSNALMFISLKSTLLLVVLTSKRSSKSSPSSITPMTKELTSTNGSTLLKNTKSILTKKVESATKKSITSKRKSKVTINSYKNFHNPIMIQWIWKRERINPLQKEKIDSKMLLEWMANLFSLISI